MTGFFAISSIVFGNHGGQYRTRTCDPMHVKHVLIPAELTVHRGSYYTKAPGICQGHFFVLPYFFSRYHAMRRSAASP